jgi:tRNA threonylcarbamoyladenosine biosynthesis protein TsaB
MSTYLYLDTTVSATIGIFDSDKGWLKYDEAKSDKPSSDFHLRVFDLLAENGLNIKSIDGIVYAAGPGSYTGMRLSEGFCQVIGMEINNIYSFYHFEIPDYIQDQDYEFVSNAFKGEYFVYHAGESKLIKKVDYKSLAKTIYSHEKLDEVESKLTSDIIKNQEDVLKSIISKKEKKELYYYRTAENEFKVKG